MTSNASACEQRDSRSESFECTKACRSRSDAEIISKLESTLQELDETGYWLELLVDSEIVSSKLLGPLMKEYDELTRMLVTAVKNIKGRR